MSNLVPSLESFAKGAFATAAGLGTVGVSLLYYGQNYLIYPSAFPPGSRNEVPTPSDFGLPYEELNLTTPDGIILRSYLLVQRRDIGAHSAKLGADAFGSDATFAASRPTIMMFHGNGGNVGHRVPLAKVFYAKMRCNVLMLSYRGYGLSEGTPSEKGLRIDAQAALDHVLGHEALSRTPIVLYGQSIGGAVAIDLASRNPKAIRALILENTFLSLPRIVPHTLPFLGPFSFLCHQKWDSASRIGLIPASTPLLLMSGLQDEVVPPAHMQELWTLAQARVGASQADAAGLRASHFVEFPKGAHNDTCVQENYWATVAQFVAALGAEGG